MKKTVPVFFAAAAAALAVGMFLYRGTGTVASSDNAPPERGTPIVPPVPRPTPPDRPLTSAQIFRVANDEDGSHLEPVKASLPAGKDPKAAALNQMAALGKDSPLPPGTRCLSVTLSGDGVAFADFNKAFQEKFPGGDQEEALVLNAVLATLGQFYGVERVQFLVEGQKISSLGGTQSLSDPLPVPTEPSQAAQASQAAPAGHAAPGEP